MIRHATACVHDEAVIGSNVSIGPFAVIGAAIIGDDCVIGAHTVIGDGIQLGKGTEVFPGAVVGREPKGAGATSRPVAFDRKVVIGANCSIGCSAVIYYDVSIGSNCLIGDGASIREQCAIGDRCIISRSVTINYNTKIGSRVKVMDLTHLTGNMIIEDDVFISTLVGSANDNLMRAGYAEHVIGPTVRSGAFIGAGALLLPATEVGANATVGSGAVVTRTIPAGETWVGVPAKPKR